MHQVHSDAGAYALQIGKVIMQHRDGGETVPEMLEKLTGQRLEIRPGASAAIATITYPPTPGTTYRLTDVSVGSQISLKIVQDFAETANLFPPPAVAALWATAALIRGELPGSSFIICHEPISLPRPSNPRKPYGYFFHLYRKAKIIVLSVKRVSNAEYFERGTRAVFMTPPTRLGR